MDTQALPLLPADVTISQWHPEDVKAAGEIRAFCLETIKGVYGYEYRPDWHMDLDSLIMGEESWYAPVNGGTLLILRNAEGEVVGTGGVYSLKYKPSLKAQFGDRYEDFDKVGSIVRTYFRPDYRGYGMSRWLVPMLEMAAVREGYSYINLHCDAKAAKLRAHWASFGFTNFLNDETTSHYDKIVSNSVKAELRLIA